MRGESCGFTVCRGGYMGTSDANMADSHIEHAAKSTTLSLSRKYWPAPDRRAVIARRNASAQRGSGGLAHRTPIKSARRTSSAPEPHDEDGYAAVHAPNRWVQQEG